MIHPINAYIQIVSTTENLLLIIAKELKDEFDKRNQCENGGVVKLSKIVLCETEKNIFTIEF